MSPVDLKILPRFSDGLRFLYVEHAVLEREDRSVAIFTAEGRISFPAAGLGCLCFSRASEDGLFVGAEFARAGDVFPARAGMDRRATPPAR